MYACTCACSQKLSNYSTFVYTVKPMETKPLVFRNVQVHVCKYKCNH